MKRTALLGLAGLVALGLVGCNTSRITGHSRGYSAAPRMPTYAIAVTVHGGLQPTPAQWAGIQARVAQELAWHGAMLVTDIALADRIIRVDFRPSAYDPENGGHITVLGIKSNPYRSLAYRTHTGPYFPSFSFAGGYPYSSWWGASDFYSGHYYNYMGPWENGFTVAAPVATVTKPSNPAPHRPRHDNHEICPPDALHPRSGGYHSGYAANEIPRAMSTGYASSSAPAYTSPQPRWNGERSAWRSEVLAANQPQRAMSTSASRSSSSSSWSNSSRSDRSYSRSDWNSSSSDSSWSRPSYTSPSYDSSYSSSSSSGHMSSGGSSSAPVYTSPSPSSDSSSSSSGSMSTSSSSDSAR